MPLLTWNDSIAIGLPSMDAQHQRWIELINNLHEAMRQGKDREAVGKTLAEMAGTTPTPTLLQRKDC
jgi:hemerythrin